MSLIKHYTGSAAKFTPFVGRNRKESAKARGTNRSGLFGMFI